MSVRAHKAAYASKYRSSQVSHRLGGVCEGGGLGSQGRVDLGEDFLKGGRGPAEGMSGRVPLGDELEDGALEGGEVGEVGGAEAFASEDPEPLLDRVHPGAVDRGEVSDEAGMSGEPLLDEFAVMDRDVVGEQVDRRDRGGDGLVEVREEGEIFDLAFAPGGDAVDVAGAGVEGGEQVGGASALVLVLDLQGTTGLSRAGGARGVVGAGARSSRRG